MSAGSSPLARGTQCGSGVGVNEGGLIPARAGNTAGKRGSLPVPGAHPRSRGEHQRIDVKVSSEWGSSPLARGTLFAPGEDGSTERLIPARAGNTVVVIRLPSRTGAHPRSRGEHDYAAVGCVPAWGSSPLARGTRVRRTLGPGVVRLIPARAGNTLAGCLVVFVHGAHPRSRGEHSA